MLVYGDQERIEYAGKIRDEIAVRLEGLERLRGIERHSELVRVFIRASEIVQGIADAEFEALGFDRRSGRQDAGASLLLLLARAIESSWQTNFSAQSFQGDEVTALLPDLDHPQQIRVKRAEGYALYALYPESYLAAAKNSGLGPDTRVVGVRSIGVGLGALVAAALGAAPAISVRPTGHPFNRQILAAPELSAEIAADADKEFAVVDEGPGLSGSSFAAVAAWLQKNGVPIERIHLFPSHAGEPGAAASERIRERWGQAKRHVVRFEETVPPALADWVADLLGPLDGPLEEISGGGWRKLRPGKPPPADPRLERRKFLAEAGGERFLVKFAGLGEDGPRKLARAERLAAAGFTPEPVGLRYGFLVERWIEGLPLNRAAVPRQRFLGRLGAYLGYRAKNFPAESSGASLRELAEMAHYNVEQTFGPHAGVALGRVLRGIQSLEGRGRRIETDNRLHVWEWLVTEEGRLIKTDALDHAAAHDLVGCQPVEWDIAGAAVEHDLSSGEVSALMRRITLECGVAPSRDLVAVLTPCYLAFQLGLWTMAAASSEGAEQIRQQALADRYRERLLEVLMSESLAVG